MACFRLTQHLHLHCVVTGGALSRDGTRWLPTRRRFLFPVRALAQVFCAKYLEALDGAYRAHRLTFAGSTAPFVVSVAWRDFLATLHAQSWVVYAKPPFGGPDRVLAYLARYTHRVAITHARLVDLVDGVVRFRWKDYADHDRQKIMTLTAEEFLRRFLLHVLPARFVRIRHADLFGNHHRHARLDRCRALLGASPTTARPAEPPPPHAQPAPGCCPVCHEGTVYVSAVARAPDPP